ncbi:hypothetical protein Y1Q_0007289 [Alligator mississippiensis]|uniref:Uncharacterized protein n=1 Tax=Alligator mississippiensis TaxID=8496 RepID=A0A151NNF6_ALLMI|nr:hypothetical protein Y1Q_0007289 [Alligator mississippiensis]
MLADTVLFMHDLQQVMVGLHTLGCPQLVETLQDLLEDSWAWWTEDIASKNGEDWADRKFQAELLALEHESLQLLWEQNAILG